MSEKIHFNEKHKRTCSNGPTYMFLFCKIKRKIFKSPLKRNMSTGKKKKEDSEMWAVTLLMIFLNSEVTFGRLQKANYKRTCTSIVSLDAQPGPVRSRGEQSPPG